MHLRRQNPYKFKKEVQRRMKEFQQFQKMQEHDPELFQALKEQKGLERENRKIAKELRRIPQGPEREKQIEQLRNNLARLFDLRNTAREQEIKKLEQKLERAKSIMEKRKANKKAIIERYLKFLLGEPDELAW